MPKEIQFNDAPDWLKEFMYEEDDHKRKKKHKYNAKKIIIDGIKFDSIKEGRRYEDLKLMVRSGDISNLELQPVILLQPGFICHGKRIRKITYKADFKYIENGKIIIEDVKGCKTAVYRLKWKMAQYQYRDKENYLLREYE